MSAEIEIYYCKYPIRRGCVMYIDAISIYHLSFPGCFNSWQLASVVIVGPGSITTHSRVNMDNPVIILMEVTIL